MKDKEVIDHAVAIQQYCREQEACRNCVFNYVGCCIFTNCICETPARWYIEELLTGKED